jgi:hypothetical protein
MFFSAKKALFLSPNLVFDFLALAEAMSFSRREGKAWTWPWLTHG